MKYILVRCCAALLARQPRHGTDTKDTLAHRIEPGERPTSELGGQSDAAQEEVLLRLQSPPMGRRTRQGHGYDMAKMGSPMQAAEAASLLKSTELYRGGRRMVLLYAGQVNAPEPPTHACERFANHCLQSPF